MFVGWLTAGSNRAEEAFSEKLEESKTEIEALVMGLESEVDYLMTLLDEARVEISRLRAEQQESEARLGDTQQVLAQSGSALQDVMEQLRACSQLAQKVEKEHASLKLNVQLMSIDDVIQTMAQDTHNDGLIHLLDWVDSEWGRPGSGGSRETLIPCPATVSSQAVAGSATSSIFSTLPNEQDPKSGTVTKPACSNVFQLQPVMAKEDMDGELNAEDGARARRRDGGVSKLDVSGECDSEVSDGGSSEGDHDVQARIIRRVDKVRALASTADINEVNSLPQTNTDSASEKFESELESVMTVAQLQRELEQMVEMVERYEVQMKEKDAKEEEMQLALLTLEEQLEVAQEEHKHEQQPERARLESADKHIPRRKHSAPPALSPEHLSATSLPSISLRHAPSSYTSSLTPPRTPEVLTPREEPALSSSNRLWVNDELVARKKELEGQVAALEEGRGAMQEKVAELEVAKEEAERRCKALEDGTEEQERRCKALERETGELQMELAQSLTKLEEGQAKGSGSRLQRVEAELAAAKQRLLEVGRKMKEESAWHAETFANVEQLSETNEKLMAEAKQLSAKNEDLMLENRQLMLGNSELEEHAVDAVETVQNAMARQLGEFERDLKKAVADNIQLNASVSIKVRELNALRVTHNAVKRELGTTNAELRRLLQEVSAAREGLRKDQARLADAMADASDRGAEKQELEVQYLLLRGSHADAETQMSTLESVVGKQEEVICKVRRENEGLARKVRELEQTRDALVTERDLTTQTNTELWGSIKERDEAMQRLSRQLSEEQEEKEESEEMLQEARGQAVLMLAETKEEMERSLRECRTALEEKLRALQSQFEEVVEKQRETAASLA
eukprot:3938571-Rhodomonas_salina.1